MTNQSKSKDNLEKFHAELSDAKLLLEYAVSVSFKTEDGRMLPDKLIDDIKAAEDFSARDELPSAEERAKFEKASRNLAAFLSPVIVDSLKATDPSNGRVMPWLLGFRGPLSEATIWWRKLTLWTIIFVGGSDSG